MKQLIISAAFCTLFLNATFAQDQLHITYQVNAKLELPRIEGIDSAMFAGMPKEHTEMKDLYYADNKSVFQNQPEVAKPIDADDQGRRVIIRMDGGESIRFVDFGKKEKTEQTDFMGRQFLIRSDYEAPKFKLTGNQKKILDYVCQEAIWIDSAQKIVVWFAPQLAVPAGPGDFIGFPGAVLGVDLDNGQRTITATSVETANVPVEKIVAPAEGKKVSPEKFQEIVAEKQREMAEENGGNGGAVIRIIRN